jgi:adhesin/invasin
MLRLPATAALLVLTACKDDGPPPPAALVARSETAITGVAVGTQVPAPLTVKVTAANGSPLGGIAVTFAATEGGGSVTPAVDTTDNSGVASTRWRLGGTVGTQRVTATVAGVASPLAFTASTTPGAPSQVAIQAGNSQQGVAGALVATAPAVIVRDAFNNPVPGVSVLFTVASGGGTVSGAAVSTNAQGIATVGEWRLGPGAGTNSLTALVVASGVSANPVIFTATAVAGAPTSLVATSTAVPSVVVGGTLTPAPGVRVVDAQGVGVPGVAVTFVGSPGSSVVNGTATTNANGVAAPTSWQLGTRSGSYTLTATAGALPPLTLTATARAAAPVSAAIEAGNNQTAPAGRAVPVDPAVRVSDSFGNGVPGLEVLYEVTGGDGSALVRRPVTDANGVATVGAWLLGDTPGTNTLRATVQGVTITNNPLTFLATGTAGQPTSLILQSGGAQTAVAGSAVPVAPSVVVRDARGNPVAGITVAFTPGPNSGAVTGGQATTNAAGVATVGSWTLGTTSGPQTLIASLAGLPSVTITATATAGVVARLVANIDSVIPSVSVNNFVVVLPQVKAIDANGNAVAGVTITFVAKDGTGQLLTGATKVTGADGLATLTSWRLGTTSGVYRLQVLATDLDQLGLEPTFVTIATAGPAAAIAVAPSSTASQSATASTAVGTVPVVRVVDQFGNGVSGVAVTFVVSGASSTIGSGNSTLIVNTDPLGFASVGNWTMGSGSGVRTLTATAAGSGITGNPVTFTATVP